MSIKLQNQYRVNTDRKYSNISILVINQKYQLLLLEL